MSGPCDSVNIDREVMDELVKVCNRFQLFDECFGRCVSKGLIEMNRWDSDLY